MKNQFETKSDDVEVQHIQLINGEFNPEDAQRILLSLINSKIQYHQVEIFSMEERFGIEATQSKDRIEELKLSVRDIQEIIKEASDAGMKLKVTSTVKIQPVR
ncbi:MAG: hypothetical protein ACK4FS_03270 [Flavobacterium sp.]